MLRRSSCNVKKKMLLSAILVRICNGSEERCRRYSQRQALNILVLEIIKAIILTERKKVQNRPEAYVFDDCRNIKAI